MKRVDRNIAPVLLLLGVAIATPACASQLYGNGYPGNNNGYYRDIERRAYDTGFREGVRQGENDSRRGRPYSYSNHTEYRDADTGYRRNDGDVNLYRRTFRQGFQTGYGESYNRSAGNSRSPRGNSYPTYPTSPSYPNGAGVPRGSYGSPAVEHGYRDGIEAGRNDVRDRARFDPVRAKRYREGDHDYNNRYGSRDEYKREYRAAFEQGYREAYGRVR